MSHSNDPLSLRSIIAGVSVTVIGGVILAFIIQDARFAPATSTQSLLPTYTPLAETRPSASITPGTTASIPPTEIRPLATITPGPTSTPSLLSPWISLGLIDYSISQISILSDGTLYVGTNGNSAGVFKSIDNGKTWEARNNGLGGLNIPSLVTAPNDPDTVYVAADGLWATNNGGESWFTGTGIGTPIIVLSANGEKLMAMTTRGVTTSHDKGKTWSNPVSIDDVFDSITYNGVVSFIASPSDYSTIYAYDREGIGMAYKSQDDGKSWLKVPPVRDNVVTQMSISPLDKNLIYACTQDSGVFRSSDGMGSWEPVNNTLPNQGSKLHCVSIFASSLEEGKLYAVIKDYGLYVSTDKGDTWALLASIDKEVTLVGG